MYASYINTDSSFLCLLKDAYLSVVINLFIINYEVTKIIKRPVEMYIYLGCTPVVRLVKVLSFGKSRCLFFLFPPTLSSFYLLFNYALIWP